MITKYLWTSFAHRLARRHWREICHPIREAGNVTTRRLFDIYIAHAWDYFSRLSNASSDFRWKFRTEKSKLREFRNPGIQYFIHFYQLYYFYEKPINVEWNISFKLYLDLLCFTIFIVVLKNLECKHKLVIFVAFLRNFGIRERSGQILNKWRLNAFRSAPMVVITPTILTRSKKMKEAAWAAWFLR